MESTAQYWKPVWGAPERYWKPICQKREGAGPMSGTLHLAQAQSNRGRRGRKKDFPDAERLVKRLVANELTLSFVPDAEQRLWRAVTRRTAQEALMCVCQQFRRGPMPIRFLREAGPLSQRKTSIGPTLNSLRYRVALTSGRAREVAMVGATWRAQTRLFREASKLFTGPRGRRSNRPCSPGAESDPPCKR
jgi:hypothetical protein